MGCVAFDVGHQMGFERVPVGLPCRGGAEGEPSCCSVVVVVVVDSTTTRRASRVQKDVGKGGGVREIKRVGKEEGVDGGRCDCSRSRSSIGRTTTTRNSLLLLFPPYPFDECGCLRSRRFYISFDTLQAQVLEFRWGTTTTTTTRCGVVVVVVGIHHHRPVQGGRRSTQSSRECRRRRRLLLLETLPGGLDGRFDRCEMREIRRPLVRQIRIIVGGRSTSTTSTVRCSCTRRRRCSRRSSIHRISRIRNYTE